jgi:hypothetical protein
MNATAVLFLCTAAVFGSPGYAMPPVARAPPLCPVGYPSISAGALNTGEQLHLACADAAASWRIIAAAILLAIGLAVLVLL